MVDAPEPRSFRAKDKPGIETWVAPSTYPKDDPSEWEWVFELVSSDPTTNPELNPNGLGVYYTDQKGRRRCIFPKHVIARYSDGRVDNLGADATSGLEFKRTYEETTNEHS